MSSTPGTTSYHELPHQARLTACRTVGMNNPFARCPIKNTLGLSYCLFGQIKVTGPDAFLSSCDIGFEPTPHRPVPMTSF